ncbi:unnamed protein product [Effrenium voratum]|nr:unnamed protein product [Effrenium voratum]
MRSLTRLLILSNVLLALAKPHILFVLVDDLGWANVGFNLEEANPEVVTPNLDSLVASGIHLKRHYVHKACTPSRTSVQSGRLPVHVNSVVWDVCNDNTGIPYNMTGLAEKMKQGGYKTHFAGKWDAGMATPAHTPHGRGYDTSLNFFGHKNDFYSQSNIQTCCEEDQSIIDFWRTDRGASDANSTDYSEFLYEKELVGIVERHDPAVPLFLFYAPHVAHEPLQVPRAYYDKFNFMTDDESTCSRQTVKELHPIDPAHPNLEYKCRQQYAAMIMIMDEVVGNITGALKSKNMWENTLMILSSDNGGPVHLPENAASNWPLRGGKYGFFEGGIRVPAFVAGGYVPSQLRGTSNSGMIHIADWYATLSKMAQVDVTDFRAANAGLPKIDSLDVWPFLVGEVPESPRDVLPLGPTSLLWGQWKLLDGLQYPSFWQGPKYPNSSSVEPRIGACQDGCLFDVVSDPTEQRNQFHARPDLVAKLRSRLQAEKAHFFNNSDSFPRSCPSTEEHCACWAARQRYGNFLGPFAMLEAQELPAEQTWLRSK